MGTRRGFFLALFAPLLLRLRPCLCTCHVVLKELSPSANGWRHFEAVKAIYCPLHKVAVGQVLVLHPKIPDERWEVQGSAERKAQLGVGVTANEGEYAPLKGFPNE